MIIFVSETKSFGQSYKLPFQQGNNGLFMYLFIMIKFAYITDSASCRVEKIFIV